MRIHAGSLKNEDTTDFNQSTRSDFANAARLCRAHASRRHRRVIEPTTVRLPTIRTETRAAATLVRDRHRRTPLHPRVGAMTVVVTLKLEQRQLQIGGRPEEREVQALPADRANEAFDEWMRERRVRHRLDLFYVEDAQVRRHRWNSYSRSWSELRYVGGV